MLSRMPATDPPYVRRDSSLMAAFDAFPAVEVPAGPLAGPSRVFELRTYESHSDSAALNKLAMFNAGEIPIFRRAAPLTGAVTTSLSSALSKTS